VFPPERRWRRSRSTCERAVSRNGAPSLDFRENPSLRQPVDREVASSTTTRSQTKSRKQGDQDGEEGRQTGRRGIAALVGKSEQELIDFWKQRFGLSSAIPVDTARVGALTPQLRELVRIQNREERKRLTAARMKAFISCPATSRSGSRNAPGRVQRSTAACSRRTSVWSMSSSRRSRRPGTTRPRRAERPLNFSYREDQLLVRDTVSDFVRARDRPTRSVEREGQSSTRARSELAALGLTGLAFRTSTGGAELDVLTIGSR